MWSKERVCSAHRLAWRLCRRVRTDRRAPSCCPYRPAQNEANNRTLCAAYECDQRVRSALHSRTHESSAFIMQVNCEHSKLVYNTRRVEKARPQYWTRAHLSKDAENGQWVVAGALCCAYAAVRWAVRDHVDLCTEISRECPRWLVRYCLIGTRSSTLRIQLSCFQLSMLNLSFQIVQMSLNLEQF